MYVSESCLDFARPFTSRGDMALKAIVLDSRPLAKYFRPEDYLTYVLVVDSSGIIQVSYEDGEWVTKMEMSR